MNKTPQELAIIIAALLDRDPVMAAQVKNYLSADRLVEVLGLEKREEAAGQGVMQHPNPLEELGGAKAE